MSGVSPGLTRVAIYRRELPAGHPQIAYALTALVTVLNSTEQFEQADPDHGPDNGLRARDGNQGDRGQPSARQGVLETLAFRWPAVIISVVLASVLLAWFQWLPHPISDEERRRKEMLKASRD